MGVGNKHPHPMAIIDHRDKFEDNRLRRSQVMVLTKTGGNGTKIKTAIINNNTAHDYVTHQHVRTGLKNNVQ